MNRYILMPDSFKGTMSSATICQIMEKAIRRFEPDAEIVSIPVADGGEGSVDAFLTALGGEKRVERVTGPLGKTVDSFWGLLQDGKTALQKLAFKSIQCEFSPPGRQFPNLKHKKQRI